MRKGNIFVFSLYIWLNSRLVTIDASSKIQSNTYCSGPTPWIVQNESICYGEGVGNAKFQMKGNHTLYAIRLFHLSGSVRCKGSEEFSGHWGCNSTMRSCYPDHCHVTHLNQVKSIHGAEHTYHLDTDGFYTIPGFSIDDDLLIIKLHGWPKKVVDGEHFEVESSKKNVIGIHCIRVDASFIL